MTALSGLAVNHYLAPPGYGIERFMDEVAAAGGTGVGLTLAALDELGAAGCARAARAAGLSITTLNSAGNLLLRDPDQARAQAALNLSLLEAAAAMDAQALTVITGGLSGQPFADDQTLRDHPLHAPGEARALALDALAALAEPARAAGVRLALEPIHPVDILHKGVVSTLVDATRLCRRIEGLSLLVDLYHSWWDPDLMRLQTLGAPVAGFQVCGLAQVAAGEKPDRTPLSRSTLVAPDMLPALIAQAPDAFVEFELFDRHRRGDAAADLIRGAVADWRRAIDKD